MIDIVAEGFDAGVRLGEQVARDMIAVRISSGIRMAVVGAPSYFERHPMPTAPEDLTDHRCIRTRLPTHGEIFSWPLERGGEERRIRGFGRLRVASDATTVLLHIELLDREQVPMDLHRDIGGGVRILAGIEFDAAGRWVAYRVLSSRPGDRLGSIRMDPIRVPAADCLHLFKPLAGASCAGSPVSPRCCCGCTSSTSSRTRRW